MTDIFEFWSRIGKSDRVHPDDKPVFNRLKSSHGFDLRCLPSNIAGPLRTARVVLLYLSPGFSEFDVEHAKTKAGQEHFVRQRTGTAPLSDVNPAAARWRMSRLKFLGATDETIHSRVSVINIGAYHSKDFTDHHILAALPSSRAMLNWAQTVLFPQAEKGERMVVCMRASNFWGLEPGSKYGKALFAPRTNRAGYMCEGSVKETIVRSARLYLPR
jgi:hypothetical protein